MEKSTTREHTTRQLTVIQKPNHMDVLQKAANKALGGGLSGATAMGVQVTSMMWIRTTMNYQYRYGTGMLESMKTLHAQGGIPRFYRGIGFALVQGPMSRFGDTATNTGVLEFLDSYDETRNLPIAAKTSVASVAAGLFRIILMPVDTCKTIMQVEGKKGMSVLKSKVARNGPSSLYHGAMGSATATMAGHYPWFVTYNYATEHLPGKDADGLQKLVRNASCGLSASLISDMVSNSFRVLKTYRQTSTVPVTYLGAAKDIIKSDGVSGIFLRGLKTRMIANGLNGMMFAVVWKYMQEHLA